MIIIIIIIIATDGRASSKVSIVLSYTRGDGGEIFCKISLLIHFIMFLLAATARDK